MVLSHERVQFDPVSVLAPREEPPVARYAVLLTRDQESGRYSATVPDLPGFRCEGSSADEAKSIVRNAVASWMQMMRSTGSPVPEPTEYLLDSIEIALDESVMPDRSSAEEYAFAVAPVELQLEEARREFLIAEAAVRDDRFPDATRHMEWCTDLLMRARDSLCSVQPHGELERVQKLLDYALALCMQGARAGLQGTHERNVETIRTAEEIYVRGMEASRTGIAELRRFMGE